MIHIIKDKHFISFNFIVFTLAPLENIFLLEQGGPTKLPGEPLSFLTVNILTTQES